MNNDTNEETTYSFAFNKQSVINSVPPGTYDGKTDDQIRAMFYDRMLNLQIKNINGLKADIEDLSKQVDTFRKIVKMQTNNIHGA